VNLDGPSGWRLEPGVGEHRRSRLEASSNGFFAVRYDFTPAPNPAGGLVAPKWRRRLENERKTPSTGQLLRELRPECWRQSLRPEAFCGFPAPPGADAKPQKPPFPLSGLFQTA